VPSICGENALTQAAGTMLSFALASIGVGPVVDSTNGRTSSTPNDDPTAVQSQLDVHDTPLRSFDQSPAGFGVV